MKVDQVRRTQPLLSILRDSAVLAISSGFRADVTRWSEGAAFTSFLAKLAHWYGRDVVKNCGPSTLFRFSFLELVRRNLTLTLDNLRHPTRVFPAQHCTALHQFGHLVTRDCRALCCRSSNGNAVPRKCHPHAWTHDPRRSWEPGIATVRSSRRTGRHPARCSLNGILF